MNARDVAEALEILRPDAEIDWISEIGRLLVVAVPWDEFLLSLDGRRAAIRESSSGGDRIAYVLPVSAGTGPFKVRAELWYQPIGYRWAHNLGDQSAEEISRFVSYYDSFSSSSGMVLAGAEITVE